GGGRSLPVGPDRLRGRGVRRDRTSRRGDRLAGRGRIEFAASADARGRGTFDSVRARDLRRDRRSGAAHYCESAGWIERIEPVMIFHVLTIFPEFFAGPFEHGIVKRARESGAIDIRIHNLRDWTSDRHKTVDDRPFGGGEGMVLKPEPLFAAVESIWPDRRPDQKVLLLSAQGRLFDQPMAERLSAAGELLFVCGRY